MEKKVLKEPIFIEEIVDIIRSGGSGESIKEQPRSYHANDIAQSMMLLTAEERDGLYELMGAEWIAEIISYMDDPESYAEELGIERLAAVINEMDSDDAVDLLEHIDDDVKAQLVPVLREDIKADIRLIHSYAEDQIGSLMTTNYICIFENPISAGPCTNW